MTLKTPLKGPLNLSTTNCVFPQFVGPVINAWKGIGIVSISFLFASRIVTCQPTWGLLVRRTGLQKELLDPPLLYEEGGVCHYEGVTVDYGTVPSIPTYFYPHHGANCQARLSGQPRAQTCHCENLAPWSAHATSYRSQPFAWWTSKGRCSSYHQRKACEALHRSWRTRP